MTGTLHSQDMDMDWSWVGKDNLVELVQALETMVSLDKVALALVRLEDQGRLQDMVDFQEWEAVVELEAALSRLEAIRQKQ